MKPAAWIVVAVAAMVASVAWRFARRSKLAMAIALVATSLVVFGLAFAAGGWGGCSQRGDCGPVGGTLRVLLGVETLLLALLVLFAGARALWSRVKPAPKQRRRRPGMRLRDIALAIGGVLFGAMAVVLIVTGDADGRFAGLAVLLFSIAILLVPVSGRLAARSATAPKLERVEYEGTLQPTLVIPGSQLKMHLMRVACLCFAGMGLVMALRPEALASTDHPLGSVRVVGILCAVLFGAIAIPTMVLTRGPVRIELTPAGLRWCVGAAPTSVPWDAITAVWPFSIRNSWFLGIDAEEGGLRIPPRQRWLAGANRAISHADASITLEAFPIRPERLAEIVGACAADPELRRKLGTAPSLEWVAEGPPKPAPVS